MFGWCLLSMLVIIGLSQRVWKKYALKLSELNSRLTQVEELLLEVCSLVEEERGQAEEGVLKTKNQPLLETKDKELLQTDLEQPPKTKEAELPKTENKQPSRVKREEPGSSQKTKPVSDTEQPKPPLPQTGTPTGQSTKQTKGKHGATAKSQKLPGWNQQIIELWEKGLSVQEIARQIGKGQGEVQLVVDLYSQ